MRDLHRGLAAEVARRMGTALERGTRDDLNALVAILEGDLLGLLRAEERHLYPVVDQLVHDHGRATATMELDHEALAAHIARAAQAIERLRAADERTRRMAAKGDLREALLRLDAILTLHLAKEERVYAALVEQHMTRQAQERLLDRMRERTTAAGDAGETILDVRDKPHGQRHRDIFDEFDRLAVGQSLVIVNDHDPRPLSYQFAAERADAFRWEELERGPVWRVRITRTAMG